MVTDAFLLDFIYMQKITIFYKLPAYVVAVHL